VTGIILGIRYGNVGRVPAALASDAGSGR